MATRQTFSVSFYCRPSKADKKGLAPIELSLVINGKRTYLKLQRKERPDDFNRAMKSKRDNELKVYCENQRIRINSIVEDMQFADIELTAENLKECLKKGGVSNYYTLGQLWADITFTKNNELSDGDIVVDTYQRYALAKMAFYAANNFEDNTPAKNVELQHINIFQHYLRTDLKLSQSTAYNYHARTKSAFVLAFNRGKIKSNPYASFKMDKGEKKEIVFLTEDEVNTIKTKDMIERLGRIRDLFVFQCYSGLAYSDMALLTPSDCQMNAEGQIFIRKRRKKTNRLFKSVVLKDGIEVLERYGYNLPVISNVKYNAYLKEIQTICQISKTLHTHLGRTTYICYLYNKGVPIDTIAEVVGHASCYTTLKYYAKMDPKTILDTFRERGIADEDLSPEEVITGGVLSPHSEERKKRKKKKKEKQNEESEAITLMLQTTGIVLK